MSDEMRCEMPTCSRPTLTKMELESSWTTEKLYCPDCGRIYLVPTISGKASQVAPLATCGLMAVSLLAFNWDKVVEHGGDLLDQLDQLFG